MPGGPTETARPTSQGLGHPLACPSQSGNCFSSGPGPPPANPIGPPNSARPLCPASSSGREGPRALRYGEHGTRLKRPLLGPPVPAQRGTWGPLPRTQPSSCTRWAQEHGPANVPYAHGVRAGRDLEARQPSSQDPGHKEAGLCPWGQRGPQDGRALLTTPAPCLQPSRRVGGWRGPSGGPGPVWVLSTSGASGGARDAEPGADWELLRLRVRAGEGDAGDLPRGPRLGYVWIAG